MRWAIPAATATEPASDGVVQPLRAEPADPKGAAAELDGAGPSALCRWTE
jgi:hypothetical protein